MEQKPVWALWRTKIFLTRPSICRLPLYSTVSVKKLIATKLFKKFMAFLLKFHNNPPIVRFLNQVSPIPSSNFLILYSRVRSLSSVSSLPFKFRRIILYELLLFSVLILFPVISSRIIFYGLQFMKFLITQVSQSLHYTFFDPYSPLVPCSNQEKQFGLRI